MGFSRRLLLWGLAPVFALGSAQALARGGGGSRGGSSSPHSSGSHSSGSRSGGSGTGSNSSSHRTNGYTKDGTHVQPHYQTNPNSTTRDNYGTRGNVNPHNGKIGTKSPKD